VSNESTEAATSVDDEVRRRRRRGEPRRLLLEAARDVFNRKGYSTTSTREIAELANVSETSIFRNFTNKPGLFREAMVQPFVDAIDAEIARFAGPRTREVTRADTRAFVASMYDMFREHRALAAMVFAADAFVESEVAESEMIGDVRAAIDRFVSHASEEARAAGKAIDPAAHHIAIRGHMAMVAGVATFGSWYLGKRRPSRKAVIDELTLWIWLRYNPGDL
jgi:AcrR family transcriptional regulator